MKELIKLLGVGCPGPTWDHKEFVRVIGKVGFEPHGKASEAWEPYFILELPTIPAYTKFTDGWRPLPVKWGSRCMSFQGRTSEEVVAKAIQFLKEMPS